jgi:hypothetical protein
MLRARLQPQSGVALRTVSLPRSDSSRSLRAGRFVCSRVHCSETRKLRSRSDAARGLHRETLSSLACSRQVVQTGAHQLRGPTHPQP